MEKPDDFDLIDETTVEEESRSLLWLAVAVALGAFVLAVGFALFTLSSRLNGTPPQGAQAPAAAETPTVLLAQSTPAMTATTLVAVAVTSTPSAAPTSTPVPTPTPTPPCLHEVDVAFVAPADITLGCPQTEPGRIVWAAWEPFERGALLWRSDTDRAYIFLRTGLWSTVDERWSGEALPSRGEPPPGLYTPERGFGYVWGMSADLFSALGWATDVEKGFCARVQDFERGYVIQSEAVPSCTADDLFNHAATGDWQPLMFVADTVGSWR